MARRCKPLLLMLRRLLTLLLPGALLVQCAPAGPVTGVPLEDKARIQQTSEPVVHTQAQLDAAFPAWAEKAQNPINFRLAGEFTSQWRRLIGESNWGEYARSCTTAFMETGQVSLKLDYRDFVLMRAALRNPAQLSLLSPQQQKALQLARARAAAVLRPGMSDFEKLLALHDDLVQHTRYDATGGGDVYDILHEGSGSCEAYSAALCVLCELAGIPARLVTGTADGPHAWNLVQLGGAWFHVDATWDDPIIAGGARQEVSHAYFCLSDAEISRTHTWNRPSYPAAARTNSFYYRQRGLYFEDFASFWRAAMASWRRGTPRFEGYLADYGSSAAFQNKLQQVATCETPRSISWTGPEGKAGAVIITFKS